MDRVFSSGAAAGTPAAPATPSTGYPMGGNPQTGTLATKVGAYWFYQITEELRGVIVAAGITPDHTNVTQLAAAIQTLIQAGNRSIVVDPATFAPGVTDGKAVYWDEVNTRFALAVADGSDAQDVAGIADVTNAKVYAFGKAAGLLSGLTPGSRYYLDGSTAGAITTTAPINVVSVGIAKSAAEIFVDIDATVAATPGVPVGATLYVPGNAAPAGFVKKNGALLSRTTYADLYAYGAASGNMAANDGAWTAGQFSPGDGATTFRIPDGRGEFMRGWDDGRGADAGRAIGSWQADDLKSHTHTVPLGNGGPGASNASGYYSTNGPTTSSSTGGTETRPRNVAELACIKY